MKRRYRNQRQSMTVSGRHASFQAWAQLIIVYTEPPERYLKTFHWNKVKYRADKSLGEIIDTLSKVGLRSTKMTVSFHILKLRCRKFRASTMMSRISTTNTTRSRPPLQPCNGDRRMRVPHSQATDKTEIHSPEATSPTDPSQPSSTLPS